jgi:hypothetical protein
MGEAGGAEDYAARVGVVGYFYWGLVVLWGEN